MNFILNILNVLLSKIFGKQGEKTETSKSNVTVTRTENTNALTDARAAVVWVCAICLAVFWIVQYLFADYMWIKACLHHNAIVPFPLDDQKLLDLLYSVLGLGVISAGTHIIQKLFKRNK